MNLNSKDIIFDRLRTSIAIDMVSRSNHRPEKKSCMIQNEGEKSYNREERGAMV
jgi:hypothetical protein